MRYSVLLPFVLFTISCGFAQEYKSKKVLADLERLQVSGSRFFNDASDFTTLDFDQELKGTNDSGDEYLYRYRNTTREEALKSFEVLTAIIDPFFTGWKRNPVSTDQFTEIRWSTLEKVNRGRDVPYHELFKLNVTFAGDYASIGIVMVTPDEFAKPDTREWLTLQQFVEKAAADAGNEFAVFTEGESARDKTNGKYRVSGFDNSYAWHPGSDYHHLCLEKQYTTVSDAELNYYVYKSMVESFLPGYEVISENDQYSTTDYFLKQGLKDENGKTYDLRFSISLSTSGTPQISIYASRGSYSNSEQLYAQRVAQEESDKANAERNLELQSLQNQIASEEAKMKALQEYMADSQKLQEQMAVLDELGGEIQKEYERSGQNAYVQPKEDKMNKLAWDVYSEVLRMMRVYENVVPEAAIEELDGYRVSLRIALGLEDE